MEIEVNDDLKTKLQSSETKALEAKTPAGRQLEEAQLQDETRLQKKDRTRGDQ